MENIKVKSLGPIKEADINFGDLTFFIGPQASGKSILLQLIKLLIDKRVIETKLENYGFVWESNTNNNVERFFGEGMKGVWNKDTEIRLDRHSYSESFLLPKEKALITHDKEKLFYIPAQRVLCLNYGWPRFFTDFEDSVPFVLRNFSETLRQYLERGITEDSENLIFPQEARLSKRLNEAFSESIFHDAKVIIDKSAKKRLKLDHDELSLPFMTWSTGQKEFMPLLLSFYWLCQPTITRRRTGYEYVIIEEPEMGLHPKAIKSVLLQIIDLISRGYQVIVSTHSPVLLEFAWAFNILKKNKAPGSAFDELFDINKGDEFASFFTEKLLEKKIKTFYFDRNDENVTVKDISGLDAGSEDLAIAEWGGLSSFASKAGDIVSNVVNKRQINNS